MNGFVATAVVMFVFAQCVDAQDAALAKAGSDGPLVRFASVVAGEDHTCALTDGEVAYCWGADEHGQLGIGGATEICQPQIRMPAPFDEPRPCATRPRAVAGGLRFVSLSAGRTHTCGLTSDSLAYCWGNNTTGELGVSGLPDLCTRIQPDECSRVPIAVSGGRRFAAISAGSSQTCALTGDGQLYCWGTVGNQAPVGAIWADGHCQHIERLRLRGGHGYTCTEQPTLVPADVPLVQIATPYMLDRDGSIYVLARTARPGRIRAHFAALGTGAANEMCGMGTQGEMYCWGVMVRGDTVLFVRDVLGTKDRAPTADVRFTSVSSGFGSTCALDTTGALFCWGYTSDVGVPTTASCIDVDERVGCNPTPQRLPGMPPPFHALAVGGYHVCAITVTGRLFCWGTNAGGQLGVGDTVRRTSPTPIRPQ